MGRMLSIDRPQGISGNDHGYGAGCGAPCDHVNDAMAAAPRSALVTTTGNAVEEGR